MMCIHVGRYQSKAGQGVPELAHALLMNIDRVPSNLRYRGKFVFLRAGGASPLARDRRAMYDFRACLLRVLCLCV